eukprot:gene4730-6636_t
MSTNKYTENLNSDKISCESFHHIEFYAGDATTTYSRFILSLGLQLIAKSDLSTGNSIHASYVLQSGQVSMIFSAPYNALTNSPKANTGIETIVENSSNPNQCLPSFSSHHASDFFNKHGLSVKSVGVLSKNVENSYKILIENGAISVMPPTKIIDGDGRGYVNMAEIKLYGDVILRLIDNADFKGGFLPNFKDVNKRNDRGLYGISRIDHVVGNLWSLEPSLSNIKKMTGFHEFAEFVADDVGTVDSGLNSVVLANFNEYVLLPINEPTFGTKRKSQIQTYLEMNQGEGVQHIALFSDNIFETLSKMREATKLGGFEFMDKPSCSYYNNVKVRIGSLLSDEQYRMAEEYGLLIDKDNEDGILLQIFTKPFGDRPTAFFEIIQRIGCMNAEKTIQQPGCGGFGKGNFKDLFKSIENYENSLKIN